MLDFIVERSEMKATLAKCLRLLWSEPSRLPA
jgi:acetyl-CoA carboxylase beta subunit